MALPPAIANIVAPDEHDMLVELMLARATARRQRERLGGVLGILEDDWEGWVRHFFPSYLRRKDGTPTTFAPQHRDLWGWFWSLRTGQRPRPFVGIWPRKGGKSTNTELGTTAVACRGTRRYALYISRTQDQADDHVQNIAALLERQEVATYYPTAGNRLFGKFGAAKAWRRNRIRTASGFTVDALGLETAARGVKLDELRPDLLIFDDIDHDRDTPQATDKIIATVTHKLLPAGSEDMAVLMVQNLILEDGLFGRLAGVSEHEPDFLQDRVVSGPHPAFSDFSVEHRDGRWMIMSGEPTWDGYTRQDGQQDIVTYGRTAYLAEFQHETKPARGGIFSHLEDEHLYVRCDPDEVPWDRIVRVTTWVDPAVTKSDDSDACGMQTDALAQDGTIYRLESWEEPATPTEAITRALHSAMRFGSKELGIETDQGGDTWDSVYAQVCRQLRGTDEEPGPYHDQKLPLFESAKAGAGHGSKAHRASQQLPDYEAGRIVHVRGTHRALERAQYRFPKAPPLDLVDAGYWSWWWLREGASSAGRVVAVRRRDWTKPAQTTPQQRERQREIERRKVKPGDVDPRWR